MTGSGVKVEIVGAARPSPTVSPSAESEVPPSSLSTPSPVPVTVVVTTVPVPSRTDQSPRLDPADSPLIPWITLIAALIAAVVGVVSAVLQRRTGRESAQGAELRAKREEVMRTLRWAAELAVSDDEGRADLGVSQLQALYESPLLDEELFPQIDAALNAVVSEPAEAIDEIEQEGGIADVIEAGEDEIPTEPISSEVSSNGEPTHAEGTK